MPFGYSMLVVAFSVVANGFFAGAETGYTTARRISLIHRARDGRRWAGLAARLIHDRESILVTAIVGNNIAVVAGTAVCTAAFLDRFGSPGIQWAAVLMTSLNIVFGEILPKAYFRAHPERTALWAAPVLVSAEFLLAPVRWLAMSIAHAVSRALGGGAGSVEAALSRERILWTLKTSVRYAELDQDEDRLLTSFVSSSHKLLRDVMTPWAAVSHLRRGDIVADAIELVREHRHSRLPVVDDTGRTVGVVLFRDLIRATPEQPIDGYLRSGVQLTGQMGLDEGIGALYEARTQLAVVVGSDDQPLGIVTWEDILRPLIWKENP